MLLEKNGRSNRAKGGAMFGCYSWTHLLLTKMAAEELNPRPRETVQENAPYFSGRARVRDFCR